VLGLENRWVHLAGDNFQPAGPAPGATGGSNTKFGGGAGGLPALSTGGGGGGALPGMSMPGSLGPASKGPGGFGGPGGMSGGMSGMPGGMPGGMGGMPGGMSGMPGGMGPMGGGMGGMPGGMGGMPGGMRAPGALAPIGGPGPGGAAAPKKNYFGAHAKSMFA